MADRHATYQLPPALEESVSRALDQLERENIVARIWQHDHTVWQPEADEVSNRLGWLDIVRRMQPEIPALEAMRDELIAQGIRDVVLLGMGGSSLAPEVFYTVFAGEGLALSVLDSTAPDAVLQLAAALDLSRTLFIVSSKSGTTVETLSFFNFFYNLLAAELGAERARAHFVAITDPDSKLERMGRDLRFRRVFRNDPHIGGRYSALSFFGLVPAALVGADVTLLLQRAQAMAEACGPDVDAADNPAAYLGAVIAVAARNGRDKLTLIASSEIEGFGYWLEQLIAESTGKEKKGILPVEGEPVGLPTMYGDDRLFVYLRLSEDENYDAAVAKLGDAGHPVIQVQLTNAYDLGAEMWRWEMATAVAGHLLGINPFDQPNVESAKVQAKRLVEAYAGEGRLPDQEPLVSDESMAVYGDGANAGSVEEAFTTFLEQIQPGDYVALQAYLPPNPTLDRELLALRTEIRNRFLVATTAGYGPRFLHSTGQLHKGDKGRGVFIVLTADPDQDVDIPRAAGTEGTDLSFDVLIRAQALGDMRALRDAGRRVIRFHLNGEIVAGLDRMREWVDAP